MKLPRMAKTFRSGEWIGKVVVRTKQLDPNMIIIYKKGEARSLVLKDIDFSDVKGIGVFFEVKPLPEVGDMVKVIYNPAHLYTTHKSPALGGRGKKGFFNWVIDMKNVDGLEVVNNENTASS